MKVTVEREVGGSKLSLTTGELAKQASGAVVIQLGETVVLVAAQSGPPRPGIDFFPLQVDYRERLAAAGQFAGGFLKREGRPTTKEILTSRLTDRPLRPLFPEGYHDEVQIQANVLACDEDNDPDVLTITASSAALLIAPLPFQTPVSGVRVGRVDGQLIAFPTQKQMAESTLDLVVAGTRESVLMIEGFSDQLTEDEMAEAITFAHREIAGLCQLQEELVRKTGKPAFEFQPPPPNPFTEMLRSEASGKMREAKTIAGKKERHDATDSLKQSLIDRLFPNGAETTEDGKTLRRL